MIPKACTLRLWLCVPILLHMRNFAVDKQKGRASDVMMKQRALFVQHYLYPAQKLVDKLLANPSLGNPKMVCQVLGIAPAELQKAHHLCEALNAPSSMMAMMQGMSKKSPMAKGMKKNNEFHERKYAKGNGWHENAKAFVLNLMKRI